MHPHALDAARAACCGEALGKGEAMANALFIAPVDDLTPEGCEKIAKGLGINVASFRECVANPKTDDRIQADADAFRDFDPDKPGGLPTLYVGAHRIVGAEDAEVVERAVDDALRSAAAGEARAGTVAEKRAGS